MALFAVWMIVALPGCGGCQKDPAAAKKEEEEKKKKNKSKQKEKPNFEVAKLVTNPDDPDDPQNYVKPGHWVTLTQQARANNFDYRAELELIAVDKDGNRFDVDRTPYQIASSRPAVLVKGQARNFELTAYVPTAARADTPGSGRKKVWFQSRLLSGLGGTPLIDAPTEGTSEMKEYECFMLVLAREQRNYLFLKTMDSARLPSNDTDLQFVSHYRVIVPKIDDRVPLPENALTWTGIAHILWDKVNPKLLSPDQQQAFVDWIHWGGNLIISSPESLDLLKGSFLEPYLAATSDETFDLDDATFRELNEYWSLPDKKKDARRIEILAGQPMLAVRLKKHAESQDVNGTGGLVVERRIGGGRIVQTAFALDDRYLLRWKNYDGFLNGVLLRRPSRDFQPLENLGNTEAKPLWVLPVTNYDIDGNRSEGSMRLPTTNPMLTSTLRYFSRDIGYRNTKIEDDIRRQLDEALHANDPTIRNRPAGRPNLPQAGPPAVPPTTTVPTTPPAPTVVPSPAPNAPPSSPQNSGQPGPTDQAKPTAPTDVAASGGGTDFTFKSPADVSIDNRLESKDWRFGGYSPSNLSGVAGWNDFSGAAHDVRLAMQEAAGIKIPSAQFVLKMIGIYLAVLVPLNWLLFRLIGRVEWAWAATPLIAVVGTLVVIQQAQLDIGFLRSRREVAILETHAEYPRGHLTRYSLLYTYLGTGYDVALADPNTLAQPFAKNPAYVRGTYEAARQVHFRRDSDLRLRNFFVPSYASEMVHTEQMFDLGGALRLEGDDASEWEIVNGSKLTMQGAAVLYCPEKAEPGEIQIAWVGDLKPGISIPLRFQPQESQDKFTLDQWNESPVTGSATKAAEGEIRLTGLLALATKKLLMFPGDVRLVAWNAEELPGVEFSPSAAQTSTRTMILSHLRRGQLPPAARDQNVRTDFREPAPVEDPPLSPGATSPADRLSPNGKLPTP